MKEHWKLIFSLILLILVVIFALQNTATVTISLFIYSIEVPIVLVMLLSLLLGVIVGLIASVSTMKSNKHKHVTKEKELKQTIESKDAALQQKDKELADLRAQLVSVETITAQDKQIEQEKRYFQSSNQQPISDSNTMPIDKN